jgi:hypothetical protein
MRPRILLTIFLTALFVVMSGCGTVKNCPVCGTTSGGTYTNIDVIPVPEHNATGEPGGPFNSFDIGVVDPVHHKFFVSDRVGLVVAVIDTNTNIASNVIGGPNSVSGGGDFASACDPTIPPTVSSQGNLTRYGCRPDLSGTPGGVRFHLPGGFGPNGLFGGFPGAQCCAARANGVNPLSAPDGEAITADGLTLFVGNGSSSVVVFDLTNNTPSAPPLAIANIPTGFSADYDGCYSVPCLDTANNYPNGAPPAGVVTTGTFNPYGITGCIAAANGRAFADPSCGDLRADEMSYDEKDHLLLVANGDPGLAFVTLIDVSGVVGRTSHCLPTLTDQPYMIQIATDGAGNPVYNFPTCILGQIYYDGAFANNNGLDAGIPGIKVDDQGPNGANGIVCPDPSTPAPSGASGHNSHGVGVDVPCHHGPMLTVAGSYSACDQANPDPASCVGSLALAGIGGSAFNPSTGHFLVTNSNATADPTVGTVDEIDPRLSDTSCGGSSCGPVIINSFLMPSCMPTSIVQGPGNSFLVGCGDHDGVKFEPNEYIIDASPGNTIKCVHGDAKASINCVEITNVGGVDEVWYNTGDNRYYLAARDMPTGPVMGVIDAKTKLWLPPNVPTNTNSHSIAVDPNTNHVFVPLQAGPTCTTESADGCIGVFAQQ